MLNPKDCENLRYFMKVTESIRRMPNVVAVWIDDCSFTNDELTERIFATVELDDYHCEAAYKVCDMCIDIFEEHFRGFYNFNITVGYAADEEYTTKVYSRE